MLARNKILHGVYCQTVYLMNMNYTVTQNSQNIGVQSYNFMSDSI